MGEQAPTGAAIHRALVVTLLYLVFAFAGALGVGITWFLQPRVYARFAFREDVEVVIHDGGDFHEVSIGLLGEVRRSGGVVSAPVLVTCVEFDHTPTFSSLESAGGALVGVTVREDEDDPPRLILLYDREREICYPRDHGWHRSDATEPDPWLAAFARVADEHPQAVVPR